MEELSKSRVLIVAGTGFLGAYSGTLSLARALQRLGYSVKLVVVCPPADIQHYQKLDVSVVCMPLSPAWILFRRFNTLIARLRIFIDILLSRRVIVTEDTFALEAVVAKCLLGRRLKLTCYFQELRQTRDREAAALHKCADLILDVESGRAATRKARYSLVNEPYVLRNTLHKCFLPSKAPAGTLGRLAEIDLPAHIPILLHIGGVGREKPLERVIDALAGCRERVFFLAFCLADARTISRLHDYAASRLRLGYFRIVGPKNRTALLECAWEADMGIVDYSLASEQSENQQYCAPTKLYEYMAMGLAIVGSENDSLRRIIEAEKIGHCATDSSVSALSVAIDKTARDWANLRCMQERAELAFEERHCYEMLCDPVVRSVMEVFE